MQYLNAMHMQCTFKNAVTKSGMFFMPKNETLKFKSENRIQTNTRNWFQTHCVCRRCGGCRPLGAPANVPVLELLMHFLPVSRPFLAWQPPLRVWWYLRVILRRQTCLLLPGLSLFGQTFHLNLPSIFVVDIKSFHVSIFNFHDSKRIA